MFMIMNRCGDLFLQSLYPRKVGWTCVSAFGLDFVVRPHSSLFCNYAYIFRYMFWEPVRTATLKEVELEQGTIARNSNIFSLIIIKKYTKNKVAIVTPPIYLPKVSSGTPQLHNPEVLHYSNIFSVPNY